jgi:hypothetical protein
VDPLVLVLVLVLVDEPPLVEPLVEVPPVVVVLPVGPPVVDCAMSPWTESRQHAARIEPHSFALMFKLSSSSRSIYRVLLAIVLQQAEADQSSLADFVAGRIERGDFAKKSFCRNDPHANDGGQFNMVSRRFRLP